MINLSLHYVMIKELSHIKTESVAATVLAYSKLEILKELLASLKKQTRKPDEIIVVFQGYDEDIWEWLILQSGISLYRQENLGSAGGFSKCIQYSIKNGHGWTWILDDDAIPDSRALEYITESNYFRDNSTGYISSRIVNSKGKTYMSPIPADANKWYGSVLDDGFVQVIRSTWLGLCVSSKAVLECGLPIEEYFLWDEDIEYTARISRRVTSYCAIRSIIRHYQNDDFDPKRPGDAVKYNYWVRNRVITILRSDSSVVSKIGRIVLWSNKVFINAVTRKAPAKSILYLLYGILFFRPKIKFITEWQDICKD